MNNKIDLHNLKRDLNQKADSLRSEASVLDGEINLYESMSLSGRIYSLTPEEVERKKTLVKNTRSEVKDSRQRADHFNYKAESDQCLSCEKVLTCSMRCNS